MPHYMTNEKPPTDRRESLQILGRTIGTFDGWDGDDIENLIFYTFKPVPVLAEKLPEGDLSVNYGLGEFTYYEDNGTLSKRIDMFSILTFVEPDPKPTEEFDAPTVQS